jgi:hypothetical protein
MLIIFKSHAPDGHGTTPMARYPAPTEPTPAQAESGNYPKRLVRWNGLRLRIENEAGSIRYGRGWQTRMLYPYGYEVDVYLGPALDYAPTVFVVHQRKYGRWSEYDEDKAMLGFMSMEDAAAAYLKHYDDPRFLGPITEMPVDEFVRKAKATRDKPGMIKAHVQAYTKKDGSFVAAHDDSRHARYAEMFKPSLGIKREDMPQVPSGVKQKFLDELTASGISVEHQTVKPSTLKPTQGTYNAANMDYLTEQSRAGSYDSKSPILVSRDGRVLDGHHRWAVAHLEGHDQPIIRIGLPIEKLLVAAKKFCAENGVESRGTTGGPTLAKGLSMLLFLKARVGPYLRGGKLVNLSGYQGRAARAQPSPGQMSLFASPGEDSPAKPNPFKGKDPVLDTPDLFTGKTRREEPVEAPPKPQDEPGTKTHVTDTPEFKRWFGDSKVVDAQGRPLVVYHGTSNDFAEFKPAAKSDSNAYNRDGYVGMFFAGTPESAEYFAGDKAPRIMPVYLSLKNPLVLDMGGQQKQPATVIAAAEKAKKDGHDGLVLLNLRDAGTVRNDHVLVAFDPTQIKSAIGNSGAFDPGSSDITKSQAGTEPVLGQRSIVFLKA